jgi:polyferredoxin
MYKKIRLIRIIVACAVFIALSYGLAFGVTTVFEQMQIVPAIIIGSAIWLPFWAVITLLIGRIYCSTVCPIGTISDIAARIGMTIKRKKARRRFGIASAADLGYHFSEARRQIRAVIFTTIFVLSIIGVSTALTILDPFDIYRRALGAAPSVRGATSSAMIQIVSLAFIAFVAAVASQRGRLLCNTICPVGTLLGCASPYAVYNIDINTDKCVGCGACERVCRAECINPSSHKIDISRCVVCFDCTSVCPSDAITFRRGKHKLTMPMLQSITPTLKTDVSSPEDDTVKLYNNETISRTSK